MQYVEISIVLGSDPEVDRWFAFSGERQMEEAIGAIGELTDAGLGFGVRDITLEGKDADVLFAAVAPILATFKPLTGSFAVKRYGAWDDKRVREERIELGGC